MSLNYVFGHPSFLTIHGTGFFLITQKPPNPRSQTGIGMEGRGRLISLAVLAGIAKLHTAHPGRRMALAGRQFVELHLTNPSTTASTAIDFVGELYGIARGSRAIAPPTATGPQTV